MQSEIIAKIEYFWIFIIPPLFEFSQCQFVISHNIYDNSNTCDKTRSSRLVEHFFNLIFTEFQSTPPVCTCVQMCPNRPAYCYPNGCMIKPEKESDSKHYQEHYSVNNLVHAPKEDSLKSPPTFDMKDHDDYLSNFYITSQNAVAIPKYKEKSDNLQRYVLRRPSIFKDRINTLIKYKRMPTVELKYNLREQVKSMKAAKLKMEGIDMSKTRWPNHKQNTRRIEKDEETAKNNFITPEFSDNTQTLIKSGLTKRDSKGSIIIKDINILKDTIAAENETLLLEDLTGIKVFSINSPVENLSKQKKVETTVLENKTHVIDKRITYKYGFQKDIIGSTAVYKEHHTNNQVLTNSEKEYNNTFNEMIASLASIGESINASMDVVEQFVEDIYENKNKHDQFQNTIGIQTMSNRTSI